MRMEVDVFRDRLMRDRRRQDRDSPHQRVNRIDDGPQTYDHATAGAVVARAGRVPDAGTEIQSCLETSDLDNGIEPTMDYIEYRFEDAVRRTCEKKIA